MLIHEDQAAIDPLDLSQWEFMVLATTVRDEHCPLQQVMSPSRLRDLGARLVTYAELAWAVREAGRR